MRGFVRQTWYNIITVQELIVNLWNLRLHVFSRDHSSCLCLRKVKARQIRTLIGYPSDWCPPLKQCWLKAWETCYVGKWTTVHKQSILTKEGKLERLNRELSYCGGLLRCNRRIMFFFLISCLHLLLTLCQMFLLVNRECWCKLCVLWRGSVLNRISHSSAFQLMQSLTWLRMWEWRQRGVS